MSFIATDMRDGLCITPHRAHVGFIWVEITSKSDQAFNAAHITHRMHAIAVDCSVYSGSWHASKLFRPHEPSQKGVSRVFERATRDGEVIVTSMEQLYFRAEWMMPFTREEEALALQSAIRYLSDPDVYNALFKQVMEGAAQDPSLFRESGRYTT